MFIVLKEQFIKSWGRQIFQNFSSNLHILGIRGINETCSILRTCNSGLTCEPVIWCFLLGACELIHVTLCKKKINIYTENIR